MTADDAVVGDGTSAGSRTAQRLRRWRLLAAVLGLALVAAVLGVLALPRTTAGALEPDSPSPQGSRALAQVLGEGGVQVQRVGRVADAVAAAAVGDATLLVVMPDLLPPDLVTDLAGTGADLVLVEPDGVTVSVVAADLEPAGRQDQTEADPGCDDPDAVAAGRSSAGGSLYRAAPGASGVAVCFGSEGRGSYAVWSDGDRTVTLVGQPAVLTNEFLADGGNAALALRTLGGHDRLVWLMASPLEGATGGGQDPGELLPQWVGWVALQLGLVVLLAIVWRSRRLGRLVPEPLPVVVRSAETAIGRAGLYRRAGARGRAAAVLRAASLRRLAARVGLPSSATGPEVTERAAAASGRAATDVHHLLLGPPPADDHALTMMADELDTLERDVSRP